MPIKEFSCVLPSCKYGFKDGIEAIFLNGKYRTDNDTYIAELLEEIKKHHPHIHSARDVDSLVEDPLAGFKEKMRAELLAEIAAQTAAANNPNNDRGGDKTAGNAVFNAQTTDASLLTIAEGTAAPKTIPVINVPTGNKDK